ncbi:MAG: glycosyltransferase family 2 protein [Vicinamibacterales bacterium]
MTAIAAVIVNYNAGDELQAALASLAQTLEGREWEAVVVDNASTDGSAAFVAAFAPRVRLVANATNVGFGRGVNQGVAATAAPFVLVMNPDCRLTPGAVDALQRELERHPRCAVVGPRILDPDGAVQRSARGDPDMLTGLFGRSTRLTRLFPSLAEATRNVVTADGLPAGHASLEVDWVSGACMLARRAALADVRGFDEGYFLYWEDADLCRRLRAAGWHVRYVPGATAVHTVGRSSRTAPAASIRAFHQSAYRYYTTHVATRPFDPRRPLARAVLAARCRLRLLAAVRQPSA